MDGDTALSFHFDEDGNLLLKMSKSAFESSCRGTWGDLFGPTTRTVAEMSNTADGQVLAGLKGWLTSLKDAEWTEISDDRVQVDLGKTATHRLWALIAFAAINEFPCYNP